VHGTPNSPFTAPGPDSAPGDFEPYEGRAQIVVHAHVHRAFLRRLRDGTIVVNMARSASDGPTASYLLIDLEAPDVTFTHRRVPFDRRAGIAQAKALGDPLGEYFVKALDDA
jgi:hypothetical protein